MQQQLKESGQALADAMAKQGSEDSASAQYQDVIKTQRKTSSEEKKALQEELDVRTTELSSRIMDVERLETYVKELHHKAEADKATSSAAFREQEEKFSVFAKEAERKETEAQEAAERRDSGLKKALSTMKTLKQQLDGARAELQAQMDARAVTVQELERVKEDLSTSETKTADLFHKKQQELKALHTELEEMSAKLKDVDVDDATKNAAHHSWNVVKTIAGTLTPEEAKAKDLAESSVGNDNDNDNETPAASNASNASKASSATAVEDKGTKFNNKMGKKKGKKGADNSAAAVTSASTGSGEAKKAPVLVIDVTTDNTDKEKHSPPSSPSLSTLAKPSQSSVHSPHSPQAVRERVMSAQSPSFRDDDIEFHDLDNSDNLRARLSELGDDYEKLQVSIYISLNISLYLYISIYLYLSISLYLYLSLSLCLYIYL